MKNKKFNIKHEKRFGDSSTPDIITLRNEFTKDLIMQRDLFTRRKCEASQNGYFSDEHLHKGCLDTTKSLIAKRERKNN